MKYLVLYYVEVLKVEETVRRFLENGVACLKKYFHIPTKLY